MTALPSHLAVRSAVVAALVLIVLPCCNLLVLVPPNVGSHVWRFGAIGILDNTITLPIVGLAILNVVLWSTEHRRSLRASSLLCFLGAVVVLGLLGLFALDAIQTRRDVLNLVSAGRQPPVAVRTFYVNTIKAAIQAVVASVALLVLAAGSWGASRRMHGRRHVSEPLATPIARASSARAGQTGEFDRHQAGSGAPG